MGFVSGGRVWRFGVAWFNGSRARCSRAGGAGRIRTRSLRVRARPGAQTGVGTRKMSHPRRARREGERDCSPIRAAICTHYAYARTCWGAGVWRLRVIGDRTLQKGERGRGLLPAQEGSPSAPTCRAVSEAAIERNSAHRIRETFGRPGRKRRHLYARRCETGEGVARCEATLQRSDQRVNGRRTWRYLGSHDRRRAENANWPHQEPQTRGRITSCARTEDFAMVPCRGAGARHAVDGRTSE